MNLEKMSLKEIYEKYGLSTVFDQEVKTRYEKRLTAKANYEARDKMDNYFNFQELAIIFNSDLKAVEYLLNLLQIDFQKLVDNINYISEDVCKQYLSKDYSWLNNWQIAYKVDTDYLLKILLIDEQIINYPNFRVGLKIILSLNKFLLTNNIKTDILFKLLSSHNFYNNDKIDILSYEVCQKYLSKDYSWLKNSRIVDKVENNFLFEVLFLEKKLNDCGRLGLKYLNPKKTNEFLLNHDIDYDLFIKFLNSIAGPFFISESVCDKYLSKDYSWLKNKFLTKKLSSKYILKVLLKEKQIWNYPDLDLPFLSKDDINDYLLENDLDFETVMHFWNIMNGTSKISDEVYQKYLSKDYSWLDNYEITSKIEKKILLKVLLEEKQIWNYPKTDLTNLTDRDVEEYILQKNIDENTVLKFLILYKNYYPRYKISKYIYQKYLAKDYSWLNNIEIVNLIDPYVLLKILLIEKQILNYDFKDCLDLNYPGIDDFLLNNDLEKDIVLKFLNLNISWYWVDEDVFDKYLLNDCSWLANENIFNKLDDELLAKFFALHEDVILNDLNYKKQFLKLKGDVTSKIIEDSLLKKEYDYIIDFIKNDNDTEWIIRDNKDLSKEEEKRKILSIYKEYNNLIYNKEEFKVFVITNYDKLNENNIKYIIKLIYRVSFSNSSELRRVKDEVISILINSPNAFSKIERIENVFLKNNIPFVGKAYTVFDILYPDKTKVGGRMLSPVLQKWQGFSREVIIFADLIKASFGSNNRSVRDYLQSIEEGNILFDKISKGEVSYESLNNDDKLILKNFCNHLITLYDRTKKGQKEELDFQENPIEVLQLLKEKFSFNGHIDYNLPDRIVKMFCHFAGIDTLEQAKGYMEAKVKQAEKRNRERAAFPLEFKDGDFVKGIGGIDYLGNILQNGSVAKEFLGSSADSDATPLDTDVCCLSKSSSIGSAISNTVASGYGPIYFILKNDNRFVITRDSKRNTYKGNPNKLEAFYTGVLGKNHYGIRTGFASSDIDYIVTKKYDERIGLEIAINGFYIPVCDFTGKVVFTPKDYDKLRSKIQGLTHLGSNNYQISPYLKINGTKEMLNKKQELAKEEQNKLSKIQEVIKEAVEKCQLELKIGYDGNLEEGVVELLNTGSTARNTNLPNNADYDYILRIDTTIMKDNNKLKEFLNNLKQYIKADKVIMDPNKLRFLKVDLGNGEKVDIDLSYMAKLDKLEYSTEVALEERLKTIKKISAQDYDYVIANILVAKKVLKENGVYKPYHSPECLNGLGGLGGVGIENWILQNNGSFFEAINSFLQVAHDKDFNEFQKKYFIWDFGENHYALKRNDNNTYHSYPHDNFVTNNMNSLGYNKMKEVLISYQVQYVTTFLENLYENYINNNITLEMYVANLEKLKNDVGDSNPMVNEEMAKYFDLVKTDGVKRG